MSRKWLLGTAAGIVAAVAIGVAAYGQGQIITTTLTGTELISVQTTGPQNVAITASNLATFVNAGGGGSGSPGVFSTLSASGAVSGAGFTARFATPGPIGNTTASTGAFTTLSASTSATFSPSGTVTISPTGALTVNPTAASTIDNASVGVTTPAAGKFTTLAWTGLATGTFTTDSGQTATATVCEDTTTHAVYFGSGTAGICKGTSSIRFKEKIAEVAYGLPEILALQPVSYYTKAEFGDPTKQLFGFLAEDTASVMPRGVTEYDANGAPSSVDYAAIIPVLVNAIKEQQAQIQQLKERLK